MPESAAGGLFYADEGRWHNDDCNCTDCRSFRGKMWQQAYRCQGKRKDGERCRIRLSRQNYRRQKGLCQQHLPPVELIVPCAGPQITLQSERYDNTKE